MIDEETRAYKVKQYFYDESGERNVDVNAFSDLATHHPKANFHVRMVAGVLQNVEVPEKRSHAFIGGYFQEIETLRTDEYHVLKQHQVLLIKDFILEDAPIPGSARTRVIDVPAPVAGYISRRDDRNGLVEIADRPEGDVIARVRHMDPITVDVGDTVAYGQSLGTQNEKGLKPGTGKHVHVEMDTRYYQQFENYIGDLVSGRLPVQAEHRKDVQPLPVIDGGVMRLGEPGERVAALQRALVADGYRGVGNKSIEIDGVYRLSMQGAVIAFQQDHKLPQTGDIDPATYQLALRVNLDKPLAPVKRSFELDLLPATHDTLLREQKDIHRGLDPTYTLRPEQMQQWYPPDPARTGRTPQHHDHPDHVLHEPLLERRPTHSDAVPAASTSRSQTDILFDRMYEALANKDSQAMRAVRQDYFQSQDGQQFLQEVGEYRQAQEHRAHAQGLGRSRDGYSIGALTGKRDPRDWDHPDHALYSAIRRQLPAEVPDDMAAHVMLQAKQGGVDRANKIEAVAVQDGKAWVLGKNFAGHAQADLSQAPPTMQETVRQSELFDQQQAQQREQWLAQEQQLSRNGPSMSR